MKILLLSILIILVGCNAPNRLIKSIKRKQVKLEAKGVTIPRDTITIVKHDTIIDTYTINDTTYIIKKINTTTTLEPIVEYKTRFQTKIEYKERIKYIKEETKQAKEKTKQVKHENKRHSQWWLFFLGVGVTIVSYLFIKLKFLS